MTVNTADRPIAYETAASKAVTREQLMFWLPSILWILAAGLLVTSIALPYWDMHLDAPQFDYRQGYDLDIHVSGMVNPEPQDLVEINRLNHYVGMQDLSKAAPFERAIAVPSIAVFVMLLAAAATWRHKWNWVITIPPVFFPFVFLADLAFWLREYATNLNPAAFDAEYTLPSTFPLLGNASVGQFTTVSSIDIGWYLAVGAAVLIVVAITTRFRQTRTSNKSDEVRLTRAG